MNVEDTRKALDFFRTYKTVLGTFAIADFTGRKHACIDWASDEMDDVKFSIATVKKAMPYNSELEKEVASLVAIYLGVSRIGYSYLCTILGRILYGFDSYEEFRQVVFCSLNTRARRICADLNAIREEV